MCYDLSEHGRVFVDTDNIIAIYDKDLAHAQNICAAITDTEKRNRAVANVVAAKIASGYFIKQNFKIDVESGLDNITPFVENFDGSDVYVNDFYVDVRVYFSDEELCVPKMHFDYGILPTFYMFIKLSHDLTQGCVEGFLLPGNVNKTRENQGFYAVAPSELVTFYDVESTLYNNYLPADVKDKTVYEFLDGTLNEQDMIQYFKDLITSKSARQKLIKAANAQSVFNFVSVSPQSINLTESVLSSNTDISEENELTEDDLEGLFEIENTETSSEEQIEQEQNYSTEVTPSGAEIIESLQENLEESDVIEEVPEESEEQIENLFTGEQEGVPVGGKKKNNAFLGILVLLAVILGGTYYWYTNYYNNRSGETLTQEPISEAIEPAVTEPAENKIVTGDASPMPVESVENNSVKVSPEANSTQIIPTIEKSLDASILVSNLKIDWEVPSGYVSNASARRYLLKLGKVIQLNLKSELLLLQKPPLTNKITVELQYNQSAGKFNVVGIKDSSGEKAVDNLILETVKSALQLNISTNMESFGKLQGAPVLIIRL